MPRADVPPGSAPADDAARTVPASLSGRAKFVLGLGVVMVLLGIWIAIRPLIPPGAPLTSSRLLDMAFAAFFMIRGGMNVRTALKTRTRRAT